MAPEARRPLLAALLVAAATLLWALLPTGEHASPEAGAGSHPHPPTTAPSLGAVQLVGGFLDFTPPARPSGVTVTTKDSALEVSWTANTESDMRDYRVYVDGTLTATVLKGTTTTLVTGLVNDRRYAITVSARDTRLNESTKSPPVNGTPRDLTPPAVPTGLMAARGDGRVDLTWEPGADADLQTVRVLRDGARVADLPAGTTRWTDTGVVNDRTYAYSLMALDRVGNASLASAEVHATPTDLTPPAVPTGLRGTAGDASASLTWDRGTDADLATVRVLQDGVVVAQLPAGTTSWTGRGLQAGRDYAFRLQAVDGHGNASATTAAVVVRPVDLTAPDAPVGVRAVAGDTWVDVSWDAVAATDVARYEVRGPGGRVVTVTAPTTRGRVTGLPNDVEATFTVVAVDGAGNVSASSAVVRATPTDTTPPAVPTGLRGYARDAGAALTWDPGTDADLASVRVLQDGVVVAQLPAGTTSWETRGLVVGRSYAFRLVAVDGHGNASAASAPVMVVPVDLTPPAVPTGLAAERGDTRVDLTWAPGTDADLDRVRVLRDGLPVAELPAGTTRWTDTGVVNDRTYSYALVALDGAGNSSAASPAVRATPTDLTAPGVPTGLRGTAVDGGATLTWDAGTDPDLAAVRVLRDGVAVAEVPAGTTTWTTTGLEAGRPYAFRLVAVDGHGNASAPSAPVTVVPVDLTAPGAPTGVRAVAGDGVVDVSWDAAGPDVVAHEVRTADGTVVAVVPAPRRATRVSGLPNDVEVTYVVVALDAAGNVSGPSSPVSATPRDLTAPDVVTGVVATPVDRGLDVRWAPVTAEDVASYRVLLDGAVVGEVPASSSGLQLSGLEPGEPHEVVVVAVDRAGNESAASSPVVAAAVDAPPSAPTGVTAEPRPEALRVTWTSAPEADVVAHRVTVDGVVRAVVPAGTSEAVVTGLTAGVEVVVVVEAVDGAGWATAAAAVRAVPGAVLPTPFSSGVPPLAGTGTATGAGLAASRSGRWVVVSTAASLEPSDTNTAVELYVVDRRAGTSRRVAPLPASVRGATSDATNTSAVALSEDGRYLVLSTTAKLLPADTNTLLDVYRLDLRAPAGTPGGGWDLVSVPVSGTVQPKVAGAMVPTGASVFAKSPGVAVSADGRRVAFLTPRADMVDGDRNGAPDVVVKDMVTGLVERASALAGGVETPLRATGPALEMTPDGRYVLFPAQAAGKPLVAVRKDMLTGELRVVSTMPTTGGASREVAVFRDTGDLAISDDGRYVAFSSAAKPTAPASSWTTGLAYRVDTVTGALRPLGSGQTASWEHQLGLDPTGRYAFFSTAAALLPADTNRRTDHYRRDLGTGELLLVTSRADGSVAPSPAGTITPAEYGSVLVLSADRVLVGSVLPMVAGDANKKLDVYGRDLALGVAGSVLG
ncbi:fibronectin type 3 domain-containing protein [Pseudokineococcus lusitanus]|uniref:Fibronectin type 3 domain-containing protein n=1 Tax=Pseudokineococcus lusitanus TaxID=763993 RepID=A0A3N1GA35_9ACTN|nr:fibronectin type 3 domain-containing protein [Pseudokineococcus lusitanus]